MFSLLSAVPEQFEDIWYLYDLLLIAVIAVCAIILVFLRKRSNLTEADKSMKSAKNLLRKAKMAPARRRRIFLFSAKNVLSSAAYLYSLSISEEDRYEYIKLIDAINAAIERLDAIVKMSSKKSQKEIADQIEAMMSELYE